MTLQPELHRRRFEVGDDGVFDFDVDSGVAGRAQDFWISVYGIDRKELPVHEAVWMVATLAKTLEGFRDQFDGRASRLFNRNSRIIGQLVAGIPIYEVANIELMERVSVQKTRDNFVARIGNVPLNELRLAASVLV